MGSWEAYSVSWFYRAFFSLRTNFFTMGLFLSIVIGILAGYLGSLIFKGSGLGLVWNLIVGLIGGVIGGALFEFLGFHGQGGVIWQLIAATVGAVILLWIASMLRKK
jgi:uncharacterized membrane protein YeaQ/YmgE (transglycosylase-associated protein family)